MTDLARDSVPALAASGEAPERRGPRPAGPPDATRTLAAVVVGVVLAAQVVLALTLLDPDVVYEAGHAKSVLAVNAALAALTVALAMWLPQARRPLALLPGGLLAAATLGGAVTLGGHLWDLTAAGLTVSGAWWIGRLLLRGLRAERLRGVVAIELVLGLAVSGLVVLACGRLDAIAWWNVGALTVAVGAIGAWTAAREGWRRRAEAAEAIVGSRIGVACAGLLLLQLGWAVVWLSAPEIMFDALYSKAYLPALWAHTGSIGPLLIHPQLNIMGLSQVVAVSEHVLHAGDVGRYLQTLAWIVLTGTVWWWAGRRSPVGALAALAVGLTPQLVWESTTAYDDLLLGLGAVALAIAVFRTLGSGDGERRRSEPAAGVALAIGLLAGTCIWLKLHLLVLALALAGGWLLAAGGWRRLPQRFAAVAAGAATIAGPAFVLRWIDTGNPVFPSYNDVFRSSHYPPINERFNFLYWPQSHFWDIVKLPYEAVVNPSLMSDTAPQGAFGLLVAAVVVALLVGWRRRGRPASIVAWAAIAVSLLFWWVEFRYLRYVVPLALVAVVLVVALLRDWRPGRAGALAALVAAGVASAFYLPSTVAAFFNVPNRSLPFAAAFGRWSSEDYLRTVFPEKDALEAFQRIAPAGADALSQPHERLFLSDRDLSQPWEVARLMQVYGPTPTTPGDTFRRLRRLGIGWAVISALDPSAGQPWIPPLLARYGEVVFGDRGWMLYRLVEHPTPPPMRTVPARASQAVVVCPGKMVAVQVSTADGGQPTQVSLDSDSGNAKSGHTATSVQPGEAGWVYETAPPATRAVNVAIVPGAGARIARARIGVLGRCSDGRP
jgi:hypothetical protein